MHVHDSSNIVNHHTVTVTWPLAFLCIYSTCNIYSTCAVHRYYTVAVENTQCVHPIVSAYPFLFLLLHPSTTRMSVTRTTTTSSTVTNPPAAPPATMLTRRDASPATVQIQKERDPKKVQYCACVSWQFQSLME